MKDKKELAAIAAVLDIITAEASLVMPPRAIPNIPSPWQSWGARQTMQYRDIAQRRIIKRYR
ncbi:MAG: hypothetical protein GX122_01220 [Candidatus Cloacimonetes bacterium]|nr:hypothetical protein [Candidatus Cloacimonadota bacterium]